MNTELIEYIARSLVDSPDQVEVMTIDGEKSTILELKVANSDMGKIIGKHGRIARAIRIILSASAKSSKKRFALEILD